MGLPLDVVEVAVVDVTVVDVADVTAAVPQVVILPSLAVGDAIGVDLSLKPGGLEKTSAVGEVPEDSTLGEVPEDSTLGGVPEDSTLGVLGIMGLRVGSASSLITLVGDWETTSAASSTSSGRSEMVITSGGSEN